MRPGPYPDSAAPPGGAQAAAVLAGACSRFMVGSVGCRDSARPTEAEAPPRRHPAEAIGPLDQTVSRETLMQVAAAPMHFERNDGQAPSSVSFVARGAGYAVLLSGTETAVVLHHSP